MLYRLPIILWFVTFSAISDIHVGAAIWKDFTHSDGSGVYFELLRKIYKEEPLKLHLSPFSRTKKKFNDKELDIILGVYPEDIKHKVLPSWPLDQESSIIAFYNSNKVKLDHISDIENTSVSWVRGYDFDLFVPMAKPAYEVDAASIGFKLLSNERTDVFIDYYYNRPEKLPEHIKSFQVMPSRKIYAAFQKNIRGRELAQIFDSEMAKLKSTGELADVFGQYYATSGFKNHIESKSKITIYTDERDLLGKNLGNLDKAHSSLYQIAFQLNEHIPDYEFSYEQLTSLDQTMEATHNNLACAMNVVKTPLREEKFNFSRAITLYQGVRLYSTINLHTASSVNLTDILESKPALRLGIHSGRSYGKLVDEKLKEINDEQVVNTSNDEIAPIKQLKKGRFNFLIESPIIFNGYWNQISGGKKIYSYTLKSIKPYITGHLACKRSDESKLFLEKADLALKKLYQTGVFYKAQRALLNSVEQSEFVEAYKSSFNEN